MTVRPFSTAEIEAAASALGNQLEAGIGIRDAVGRLAKLQPRRAEVWREAVAGLSRGKRLSELLVGLWPDDVIAALKAGEESGQLLQVLARTQAAMEIRTKVRKSFGKLMSPALTAGAGLALFLFFMVAVIPKLQAGLGGGDGTWVLALSDFMHDLVLGYWPLLLMTIVIGAAALAHWLSRQDARDKLVAFGEKVPYLREAQRKLHFGAWAYQLATLDSAGLPIRAQLLLSAKTLPEPYQEGVLRMADEVEKRGRADSADPEKQAEDDPRRAWPYYVAAAFVNAHETGALDKEMSRVAPILVSEGLRDLERFTTMADVVSKLLVAALIALPIFAYFSQLSYALAKAFST